MAPVASSSLITCRDEAAAYYAAKLARAHEITRHDRRVTIVFEEGATHLYSVSIEAGESVTMGERAARAIAPGKEDVRRFDLERARLMDEVLPALSNFTVSTSGQGGNRLVHGPRRADGTYMKVVLRPGPGDAYTCISAYAVPEWSWKNAKRSKAARFPP